MEDRVSVYGPAWRALEAGAAEAIHRFWTLYELLDKAPVEWAALIGRLESLVPLLDARPIEEVPSSEARGPGEWE